MRTERIGNATLYLGKLAAGVDAREIVDKELSLAGIQRPLAPHELGDAQEIFRFGDFAGWIIEGSAHP